MSRNTPTRRTFLGSTAALAVAAPTLATKAHAVGNAATFDYEITRTEAEWRDRLTDDEFDILRNGSTEQRFTSDLWNAEAPGTYHCKGCELEIYHSRWKKILPIGWVFFQHSKPQSVMMGIDEWPGQMTDAEGMSSSKFVTEAHCRRCGSHLGHILLVSGSMLHCINGTALTFQPAAA